MKIAIAKEHRIFFQKKGWIEFENFVTADQLALINSTVDQVLALRLKAKIEQLKQATPTVIYEQGRDLWRLNDVLRLWVCQPRFAEIASELIETKPLRLGYDQLLSTQQLPSAFTSSPPFLPLTEQLCSLESISCVQEVLCGLMIALGPDDTQATNEEVTEELTKEAGLDVFPKRAGQVVFFQSQVLIDWKNIIQHKNQRFYLIVYTQKNANYILHTQDPHTHFLKKIGYVFNDKLLDRTHPIVYR